MCHFTHDPFHARAAVRLDKENLSHLSPLAEMLGFGKDHS